MGSFMNGELPSLWTTVKADSESERPIMALSSSTNVNKSQGKSKSKSILTKSCKYCVAALLITMGITYVLTHNTPCLGSFVIV